LNIVTQFRTSVAVLTISMPTN